MTSWRTDIFPFSLDQKSFGLCLMTHVPFNFVKTHLIAGWPVGARVGAFLYVCKSDNITRYIVFVVPSKDYFRS